MVRQYAEKKFLEFLVNKLFADVIDEEAEPSIGTYREIIDYMKNNDSAWEDTYKAWRQGFDNEFQKYKADPGNYKPPRP